MNMEKEFTFETLKREKAMMIFRRSVSRFSREIPSDNDIDADDAVY